MKKILIVSFLFLLITNCYCQELTFLGIPLKGSKADFTKELTNKGFDVIPEDEEEALFGFFMGEPCILKTIIDENDEIHAVTVILVPDDNWPSLHAKYTGIKTKLLKDLGSPSKDESSFNMPSDPKSDITKYQAVTDGKCEYHCFWLIMDVGVVNISINHLTSGENCVEIIYLKMDDKLSTSTHMKFKGISLGESPYDFTKALERQGYTYNTKVDDTYVLTGTFAGYSNCKIYVTAAQYDNMVDHVGVNFPEQTKWEYLLNTYSSLKDMLTQKYGEPESCIEEFNTSSKPISEFKIMSLLKNDEFKYETLYNVEGGFIKLVISHLFVNYEHYLYVSLIYVNGPAHVSTNKRAIDDL